MKLLIFLGIVAFLLIGCTGNSSAQESTVTNFFTTASPVTADNSKTSLDWEGGYKGTIPRADFEAIETIISIGTHSSYTVTLNYLGKKIVGFFERKGNFSYNDAGTTIILSGISDGPSQYLVGENKLIQLDLSGNRITGNLADNYELSKQ